MIRLKQVFIPWNHVKPVSPLKALQMETMRDTIQNPHFVQRYESDLITSDQMDILQSYTFFFFKYRIPTFCFPGQCLFR